AKSNLGLRRRRWNSITSPGNAPSTKTTFPAARATPHPFCASDRTCAAGASAGGEEMARAGNRIALPGTKELLPVSAGGTGKGVVGQIDLAFVLLLAQRSAQELEAQ